MKRLFVWLFLIGAFLAFQANSVAQAKNPTATSAEAKGKQTTPKTAPTKEGKAKDPVVGKTAEGKTVYEGARGGHYYLNEKGEKVYVQEFVGAKIVGKTADGKNIFQGSKGGKFYYSDKGKKVYLTGK